MAFAELERSEVLVCIVLRRLEPIARELSLGAGTPTVNFAPCIAVVDFDPDSIWGY